MIGDSCTLGADDCGAGAICLKEGCGTTVARCYQFCSGTATNNTCPNGLRCDINVNDQNGAMTSLTVCELPTQTCNPVGQTSGCATGLACYVDSTGNTTCDCPGAGGSGARCTFSTDCAPGYTCVGIGSANQCRKACHVNSNDCGSPGLCSGITGTSTYGYCPT
jgi:hypothetical protein